MSSMYLILSLLNLLLDERTIYADTHHSKVSRWYSFILLDTPTRVTVVHREASKEREASGEGGGEVSGEIGPSPP